MQVVLKQAEVLSQARRHSMQARKLADLLILGQARVPAGARDVLGVAVKGPAAHEANAVEGMLATAVQIPHLLIDVGVRQTSSDIVCHCMTLREVSAAPGGYGTG